MILIQPGREVVEGLVNQAENLFHHRLQSIKGKETKMKKLWARITAFVIGIGLLAPGFVLAGGGGPVEKMVIVADSRNLSGVMAWWANMYNESHLEFTILTVLIIPIIGLCFGLLADVIMAWIGIDLKNRELAEH
jgi:hypothetical protein